MANEKENNPVEQQKKRQQEQIELKKLRQEFERSPESFVAEGPAAAPQQSTKSKVSNFWYYSKYTIAFMLIIAIILTIGIAQCTNRIKYDCTVVVYLKRYVSSTMIENISSVAEKYCEDYNGDGEVNVRVVDCSVSDAEKMTEYGQTKVNMLMGQLLNEEAIIYIVDKAALEGFDEVAGGVFVDDSLGLPEYNGRAFKLNGSSFDTAFDVVSEGFSSEMEYYIVRRRVSDTLIDDKKDVAKHSSHANEIITKIMSDPKLEKLVK